MSLTPRLASESEPANVQPTSSALASAICHRGGPTSTAMCPPRPALPSAQVTWLLEKWQSRKLKFAEATATAPPLACIYVTPFLKLLGARTLHSSNVQLVSTESLPKPTERAPPPMPLLQFRKDESVAANAPAASTAPPGALCAVQLSKLHLDKSVDNPDKSMPELEMAPPDASNELHVRKDEFVAVTLSPALTAPPGPPAVHLSNVHPANSTVPAMIAPPMPPETQFRNIEFVAVTDPPPANMAPPFSSTPNAVNVHPSTAMQPGPPPLSPRARAPPKSPLLPGNPVLSKTVCTAVIPRPPQMHPPALGPLAYPRPTQRAK